MTNLIERILFWLMDRCSDAMMKLCLTILSKLMTNDESQSKYGLAQPK